MKIFLIFFSIIILGCNNSQTEQNDIQEKQDMSVDETRVFNRESEVDNRTPSEEKSNLRKEENISKTDNSSIRDFYIRNQQIEQVFIINTQNDTMIFGDKGTVIFIPKDAFESSQNIQLKLKEFYSPFDIVMGQLSTLSNNKIIETMGMIDIQAYENNKSIKLKNGKKLIVHFPKGKKEKKGTKLFYGETNISNGILTNWKLDVGSSTVNIVPLSIGMTHDGNYLEVRGSYNSLQNSFLEYFSLFRLTVKDSALMENSLFSEIGLSFSFKDDGSYSDIKIIKGLDDDFNKRLVKYLKDFNNSEFYKKWSIPKHKNSGVWLEFKKKMGYKSTSNYREQFNNKYSQFKNQNINNINQSELRYYIFEANEMGLINCDRFIKYSGEKVDVVVDYKIDMNTNYMLVFKDSYSFMRPIIVNNKYVFDKIPKGMKASVVALKYANKKALFSLSEIIVSEEKIKNLNFKETTLAEIEVALNKLKN